MADLTAADHALAVSAPDDPETVLACGALGGVLDASGSLVVGLLPESQGRVSGVAYPTPSDAGTAASLFVVDPVGGLPAQDPGVASAAQEDSGGEAAPAQAAEGPADGEASRTVDAAIPVGFRSQ